MRSIIGFGIGFLLVLIALIALNPGVIQAQTAQELERLMLERLGDNQAELNRELEERLERADDPLLFMKETSCIVAVEIERDEEGERITVEYLRPADINPVTGGAIIPDSPEILLCTMFIPKED